MYSNQSQEQKIQELVAKFSKLSQEEKDFGLIEVAVKNSTDYVDAFIKCGANIEAKDNNGFNVLMLAVERGYRDIVDMLINKYHADVKAKGLYSFTALMFAAKNGDTDTAVTLLEAC